MWKSPKSNNREHLNFVELSCPEHLNFVELTNPEHLNLVELTYPEHLNFVELTCSEHLNFVELTCPEHLNLAPIAPCTAASTSALWNTMNGAFPPNSRETFLTVEAHC